MSFMANILTSSDELHEYAKMFELMDVNKTGRLTIQEIKDTVDKHMDAHHFEANEWSDILHSMDTDDD